MEANEMIGKDFTMDELIKFYEAIDLAGDSREMCDEMREKFLEFSESYSPEALDRALGVAWELLRHHAAALYGVFEARRALVTALSKRTREKGDA